MKGIVGIGIRYVLVSRLAGSCGENVSVLEGVYLFYTHKLHLGNNVSIHPLCYIDAQGDILIGNDVSISHNVSIVSFEHDYSDASKPIKDAAVILKEVVIEDDVWIGAGARVLAGARIGAGSVIGAGAVVKKDIPPMSVAVGVPAHVVRSRKRYGTNS
jgi:acetyltransferase-like isoleucine patch superfamily enzyme